jgi:site-specific DNA recombinase
MPRGSAVGAKKASRKLCCAIYTRKSTEEGLEQDFNSLDAQREACEAFIASQKHEGWIMLPTGYDDGGYSGGTLERPALQRLLADIKRSKVDVVVVYKIDRLTRSLLDFAKIVEVFDVRRQSFWDIELVHLREALARLLGDVMRPADDAASVDW